MFSNCGLSSDVIFVLSCVLILALTRSSGDMSNLDRKVDLGIRPYFRLIGFSLDLMPWNSILSVMIDF